MGTLAKSKDTEEMPHSVAFHQGQHSAPFAKIKTIYRD